MHFESIAEDVLDREVTGGIDWNQVGMQTMQGAAAGGTVGWLLGAGVIPFMIGGGAAGAGMAIYSTWHQPTQKR
jgi:hypothetical protein